jgi:hypothetical protein
MKPIFSDTPNEKFWACPALILILSLALDSLCPGLASSLPHYKLASTGASPPTAAPNSILT